MCGIIGAIGRVDERIVEGVRRGNAAQRHRGPDDEGIWIHRDEHGDGGVVLAHRRLAVIDPSPGGHQPMTDPASGCTIVYNGEAYNFEALRRDLQQQGVEFRSRTDTEVVLQLFAREGDACLPRLGGMFAMAIWDPRSRELVLVRDRLGVKPLYVAEVRPPEGGRVVLFASELRALLATGLIEGRLDPVGHASYLWHGFVAGPSTIVRGVRLMRAGSTLSIDLDGASCRSQSFWRLPGSNASVATVAEVRDQFRSAVAQRLISDVPVGVFLSGGVDSSAVAAAAARSSGQPVRTFNVSFPEVEYDESPYARAVAKALGTDHAEITLTEAEFRGQVEAGLAGLDQPTFDGLNTYIVSRAARLSGVTVALAGTGGDELFGGYTSFRDLPRAVRWARQLGKAPPALTRIAAAGIARVRTGRPGDVPPQTRWAKLAAALETRGRLLDLYQLAYALFLPEFQTELSALEGPDLHHLGLPRSTAAELDELIEGEPMLHAISLLELSSFVRERLLRDTDTVSMACSLEVRVPLLDASFVTAVAGVAEHDRFVPLGRKALLRSIALDDLDPSLFERPKAGFVLPLDRWCRDGLRDRITEVFEDASACHAAGLDQDAVLRLWRGYEAGAPGIYWSRVWSLFILLQWCARHGVAA